MIDIDVVGKPPAPGRPWIWKVVEDQEADEIAVEPRTEDLGCAILQQLFGVIDIGRAWRAAKDGLDIGRKKRREVACVPQAQDVDLDVGRIHRDILRPNSIRGQVTAQPRFPFDGAACVYCRT